VRDQVIFCRPTLIYIHNNFEFPEQRSPILLHVENLRCSVHPRLNRERRHNAFVYMQSSGSYADSYSIAPTQVRRWRFCV
jgi:hypothetical protein